MVLSEGQKDRRVKIFLFSTVLSVFQWVIIIQSEPTLISELVADKTRIGDILGNSQGLAGVMSFALYPFMGKLTDAVGRKSGLLLSPISNAITGALVTLNPHNLFFVLLNRVMRMFTLSFSNTVMIRSAFSDFLTGPSLAIAFSKIFSAIGLGTVVAPQIETVILKSLKSPRYPYALYTFTALLQSIYHLTVTPETLAAARRLALDSCMTLQNINPLKFLKVFTQGSSDLQKMSIVYGFQMLGEGKNTQDMGWSWMVDSLKWDVPSRNAFISGYGISGIGAGMFLVPAVIKKVGVEVFTTIANIAVGLSSCANSVKSGYSYSFGLLLALPGINGVSGTGVSATASELAGAEGFGKGEFGGMIANFRSIAGIVGPVLMGKYITWLKARGLEHRLGTAFLVYAFFSVVTPQLIHMTIDYERVKAKIAAAK